MPTRYRKMDVSKDKVNDVSVADFELAIQATHGARARLLAREIVKEVVRRKTVWEGEVLVFELLGHPRARLRYAWEVDGEVVAVLAEGPVDSALAAVRASIMAGQPRKGPSISRADDAAIRRVLRNLPSRIHRK